MKKEGYAIKRFKGFVNFVSRINDRIREGSISYIDAKKEIEAMSEDVNGNKFVECEEYEEDGRRYFSVKKKYVYRYML